LVLQYFLKLVLVLSIQFPESIGLLVFALIIVFSSIVNNPAEEVDEVPI